MWLVAGGLLIVAGGKGKVKSIALAEFAEDTEGFVWSASLRKQNRFHHGDTEDTEECVWSASLRKPQATDNKQQAGSGRG